MPDLGLEVLLKGSNMLRLLQGLWRADDKKKCSAQGNFQSVSGIYPHYAAVGITFPVLL